MAFGNYNGFYPQGYYTPNGTPDILGQYKTQFPAYNAPSPSGNDMLWVLGEVEAQSYPVAPNNTVVLWDKDRPTVYIKSANAQGVPSIRVLDYTERKNAPDGHHCACGGRCVSADEFNAMRENLVALRKEFEEYKKGGMNNG